MTARRSNSRKASLYTGIGKKKSRQNFKIADFPIFGTLNYICYHKNIAQSIRNPLIVDHCRLIPFLSLSLPRPSHFLSPSCLLTYFVPWLRDLARRTSGWAAEQIFRFHLRLIFKEYYLFWPCMTRSLRLRNSFWFSGFTCLTNVSGPLALRPVIDIVPLSTYLCLACSPNMMLQLLLMIRNSCS